LRQDGGFNPIKPTNGNQDQDQPGQANRTGNHNLARKLQHLAWKNSIKGTDHKQTKQGKDWGGNAHKISPLKINKPPPKLQKC
jgi:hypothetical protein